MEHYKGWIDYKYKQFGSLTDRLGLALPQLTRQYKADKKAVEERKEQTKDLLETYKLIEEYSKLFGSQDQILNRLLEEFGSVVRAEFLGYGLNDINELAFSRSHFGLANNEYRYNPRRAKNKLKKTILQFQEMFALHNKTVGQNSLKRKGQEYCSNVAVRNRVKQKSNWNDFFKQKQIVNPVTNKEQSMYDIVSSFHKHRQSEHYSHIKAIQELALEQGLEWSMFTLTCPPQYHPNPSVGSNSWDGSTPKQAQEYLMTLWGQVRALLKKYNIEITGLRVVEPHKDSCPHIHLVVYYKGEDHTNLVRILKSKFPTMEENKGKSNKEGGSQFASYCFKYVMKNMGELEPNEQDSTTRVDAYRSLWSIRAFQWIGLPSRTLYRYLKKIEDIGTEHKGIKELHTLARANKVKDFIVAMGGLNIANKYRPYRLVGDKEKSIEFLPTPEKYLPYKKLFKPSEWKELYKSVDIAKPIKFRVVTVIEKLFKKGKGSYLEQYEAGLLPFDYKMTHSKQLH